MSPRVPLAAAVLAAAATAAVVVAALVWQPRESSDSGGSADAPSLTVEGVISLVSREHAGCPDQPLLVLSADAVYEGEDQWRVVYRDYEWSVNEEDGSVEAVGEPLPCAGQ